MRHLRDAITLVDHLAIVALYERNDAGFRKLHRVHTYLLAQAAVRAEVAARAKGGR